MFHENEYKIRPGACDIQQPYSNDWDVMKELERHIKIREITGGLISDEEIIPDNIIYVLPVIEAIKENTIILRNKYGLAIQDPKLYNMIKNDLYYYKNYTRQVDTYDTYKTGDFTTKTYKYYNREITYDFSKLPTKQTFIHSIKEFRQDFSKLPRKCIDAIKKFTHNFSKLPRKRIHNEYTLLDSVNSESTL